MQEKITLSSADVAKRIAFLREKQGATLAEIGGGKASTAKSWEEGKMPRRDKWQGIAERLGLSESLIFIGRPESEADYAFIAKWRNEIWDAPEISAASAGRVEEKQEPYGTEAEIEEELKRAFTKLLLAAAGDRNRLGWIAEQMKEYLAIPKSWRKPKHNPMAVSYVKLPSQTVSPRPSSSGSARSA